MPTADFLIICKAKAPKSMQNRPLRTFGGIAGGRIIDGTSLEQFTL